MKKYELTDDTVTAKGRTLHRIKALKSFSDVEEGELGGYVEREDNLDQSGDAWVCGNAWVSGDARVCGNAWVSGNALVYGDALVSGDALVYGNALVYGDAWVSGNARVCGDDDYTTAKGFGHMCRTTTFFRLQDGGIGVRCGCFYGTLEEFCKKVKETHKESKLGKEYLMLADLMEYK